MNYTKGKFESIKFDFRSENYKSYIEYINSKDIKNEDIIHQFPAYVGHMTLQRYFTLYELYKKVDGIAGHIAEVGVYKGAGSIFFSKLLEIFEPNTLTQVHGFDWFLGDNPDESEKHLISGAYKSDYDELMELIKMQNLNHILNIHKIDVVNDLENFMNENPTLRFKLVFLDSGTYKVTYSALKEFLKRLNKGGIIVFDQYNFELAPGETKAIHELLENEKIRTLPSSWMPNAYYIKE